MGWLSFSEAKAAKAVAEEGKAATKPVKRNKAKKRPAEASEAAAQSEEPQQLQPASKKVEAGGPKKRPRKEPKCSAPDPSADSAPVQAAGAEAAAKPCFFYSKGECSKGADCPFVHDDAGLDPAAAGLGGAKDSAGAKQKYIVFVGNLPFSATKDQLTDMFGKGVAKQALIQIRLPTVKGSDQIKGFAFVEYRTKEAMAMALKLHGSKLDGRRSENAARFGCETQCTCVQDQCGVHCGRRREWRK